MLKHRKTNRYKFGLTGTFHSAGERVGSSVVIRDISPLGCELGQAEGSKNGAKCELYFDWQRNHVGLEAEIVWKDTKGRAGLKFLRIDQDTQRRLEEICATLRTHHLSASKQKEAGAAFLVPDRRQGHRADGFLNPRETAPLPPLQPKPPVGRRQVPRYVIELSGHLLNPATGATARATLVNLSVSGARLEGSVIPDVGQTCELQTKWDGTPLVLRGSVVWKTEELAAVKFSAVDDETGKLLRRACAHLWLQPPGPLPI